MHDELDVRLIRALETPPEVYVPAEFRVSQPAGWNAVASTSAFAAPQPRFSVWTIRAAFVLLSLAMLLFVPWTLTRSAIPLTLEFILAAEFVGLTVWTALRPS